MLAQIKLEQFRKAEEERKARIVRAWERYEGTFPKALKPTKSDPGGDDNVSINLCRLVVDKGVSFLFGFDLKFEVDGKGEGKKTSPEEEWLAKCWDANRRMTTLHKLGINGGISGHAFLKVMLPDPARNGHPYPRLVLWDSSCVDVRWDPEDIDRVLSYTYSWHGVDPDTMEPRAYRQVIERDGGRWVILDQMSRLPLSTRGNPAGYGAWETTGETSWPYPWAPVFDCQNLPAPNEYWGRADLEPDLLDTNEDLNFTSSNINRILRGYAHPRTWGRGFGKGDLELGPDNVAILPGQTAELKTLDPASDLTSSLEWFARLREAFHEVARMPEVATGKVNDLGQLSGLALQILYGPLIEVTETKRLTYGEMLELLNQRLLELGGHGGERKAKAQWPQVLPSDAKGEAETALLHEQLGVSKDTLQTRLGYDPEQEAEKKAKERETDMELGNQLLKNFDRGGTPPGGNPAPGQEPPAE